MTQKEGKRELVVLLGSARKTSDTAHLVHRLLDSFQPRVIDLLDHSISPYNYNGSYAPHDEFMEVMQQVVAAKRIVFATPVYWYAMSAQMKIFFDRLSDLLRENSPWPAKLRGKSTFLIAIGSSPTLPEGFEVPFRDTSNYFGMHYHGAYYTQKRGLFHELPDTSEFLDVLKG